MNIKKKIYEVKSTISPEEVFFSKDYLLYLHEILEVVTRKYHQKIDIELVKENPDSPARTNGYKVIINYNCTAISSKDSILEKNSVIIGLLLHEAGHILYTDFGLAAKCKQKLKNEKTFMPALDYSDAAVTMCDWIARNGVPDALFSLYTLFDNVIEDGNVDWRIMADVPGYGVCRKKLLEWYSSTSVTFEELKKEKMKSVALCFMILAYAKHGLILSSDKNEELVSLFFDLKVHIDEACKEKTSYERKRLINNLFASFFYLFIKDMENQEPPKESESKDKNNSQSNDNNNNPNQAPENKQSSTDNSSGNQSNNNTSDNSNSQSGNDTSQSSGNQSSNNASDSNNSQSGNNTSQSSGNNSSTQAQQSTGHGSSVTSEQLQSAMQNLLSALPETLSKQEEHKGTSTPMGDGSVQNSSPIPNNQTTPNKDMEKMIEQMAHNILSKQTEAGINANIREICMDIKHNEKIHNNITVSIDRATPDLATYDAEVNELKNISRKLTKNFKKDIIERQLGDVENGLYFGKRLCAKQLYREDKKIFERKTLPDDIPDMEVVLLVDLSGSMRGERIEIARKTASILYAFCNEMNIRLSVFGHHVVGDLFTIETFADADSIDNRDKYRICSMDASGCNRDGLAVRFCMERLARSTAAIKLLTVISDGRPNHTNYHMSEGKADIQNALSKYGKLGVKTITAAIGDDIEAIKEIYEHKYSSVLDISDLNRLPALFPKIIKKML